MTRPDRQWETPPVDHEIDDKAVHVWRADFQPSMVSQERFAECLSNEEIERARRFVRQSDRDRYVYSHVILRSILGAYVGCAPANLVFEAKQYHKPCLAGPSPINDIQFSLSHSGDVTLVAVSRGRAVGIDVELVRKIPDVRQIVDRFFSVDERRLFASLPSTDFDERFFVYWTSKEAFLKATGEGLSYPLDKFSVVFWGREPEGSIHERDADSARTGCWRIVRLCPGPGYSGALVLSGLEIGLRFFEYCQRQAFPGEIV